MLLTTTTTTIISVTVAFIFMHFLCCCRWAQFRQSFDEIGAKVTALVNKETVNYCQHIGTGHYVGPVTSGFSCVMTTGFLMHRGVSCHHKMRYTEACGETLQLFNFDEHWLISIHNPISTEEPIYQKLDS